MKKSIYYISIFFTALILCAGFISCKKTIIIDLPQDVNKPVLNSLIKHGKPIEVSLSLSKWLAPNESFPQITDAKVQLYENGIFKEILDTMTIRGKTRYLSKSIAQKNNRYKIVADVKGFKPLEAEDDIPDIDKITVLNQSQKKVSSTVESKFRFDFSVRNGGNTTIYYRIRILNHFDIFSGLKLDQPSPLIVSNNKNSQLVDNVETFAYWLESNPQKPGSITNYSFSTSTLPKGQNILEVAVLSESAFKYLNSSQKAGDFEGDFTSERIIIFNNIKNGLGIVGGYASSEYPFN